MPRRFGRALTGHDVSTAPRMGWESLDTGELLRRAAAGGFESLVSVDRNLEYQQNVARVGLGIVVLLARTNNSIDDLLPLTTHVLEALATPRPGQLVRVGFDRRPGRAPSIGP